MHSFEKCATCGELLREQYGSIQDNGCVDCMSADLRAADEVSRRERERTSAASAPAGSTRHKAERRQYTRCQTTTSSVLIDGTGPQNVKICDLSLGGMMFRCERELSGSDPLRVKLSETSELRARRIWQDGLRVGLMFLEAPRKVESALQARLPL